MLDLQCIIVLFPFFVGQAKGVNSLLVTPFLKRAVRVYLQQAPKGIFRNFVDQGE